MNTLSTLANYAVIALLALAFVGIAVSCLVLITRNVRQGVVVRQNLAKKIESSRINSALKLFNVDFSEYLHTAPVNRIVENMNHCDECMSPWCSDESSAHPADQESNFYFCPIANQLIRTSQAQ